MFLFTSLSLYLQHKIMLFLRVKKHYYIFGHCIFNALMQILKSSIIRWEICTYVYVCVCREGQSGADTGITLTV